MVGKRFLTAYTPIRSREGKVIGMWFAGVEKEQAGRVVARPEQAHRPGSFRQYCAGGAMASIGICQICIKADPPFISRD